MMHILNRPMVKEALVLIASGVIATMVCSKVYADPLPQADRAAPLTGVPTSAPAREQSESQLPPMSKEQGREMLLSSFHGQVPLAGPPPASGR